MSRALGQANVPVYGPRPDPMVGCCPRHMNSRVLVDRDTDATPTPTSRGAFVTTTETCIRMTSMARARMP